MRYWTESDFEGGSQLPTAVAYIADGLADALDQRGGRPRLISIGYSEDLEDAYRYEVVMEIVPGVRLPVELGSTEADHSAVDPETEGDNVILDVLEAFDMCLRRAERLSDLLHDARMRVRRTLGGWDAEGIQTGLIDVQLAPFDHWRSAEPGLVVHLRGLDSTLRPGIERIAIDPDGNVEEALEAARESMRIRSDRRTELALLGATGTIDRLALNAIRHFGDAASTLRRSGTEHLFWLPDDTAIINTNGHVTAGSWLADSAIAWSDGAMRVASTYMPASLLKEAVGRPAAELVEHEFLTPDILVADASCSIQAGRPFLSVRLTMPRFAFCAISGRLWEIESSEAASSTSRRIVPSLAGAS